MRGRYRTPTATNTELLVTLRNGRRPLSNIKKNPTSDAARALYMPRLNMMNRGRLCRLNSLLGTLPHLISQE